MRDAAPAASIRSAPFPPQRPPSQNFQTAGQGGGGVNRDQTRRLIGTLEQQLQDKQERQRREIENLIADLKNDDVDLGMRTNQLYDDMGRQTSGSRGINGGLPEYETYTIQVLKKPFGINYQGATVTGVQGGSPAEEVGVRTGSEIIAINDNPVNAENWQDYFKNAQIPFTITLRSDSYGGDGGYAPPSRQANFAQGAFDAPAYDDDYGDFGGVTNPGYDAGGFDDMGDTYGGYGDTLGY